MKARMVRELLLRDVLLLPVILNGVDEQTRGLIESHVADLPEPIDVLYLDSLDTTEPNHAEHALREFQMAESRLHEDSIVVFDDSPWHAGACVGKGATAVPYLLDRGWQILYAGYQVVLSRKPSRSEASS